MKKTQTDRNFDRLVDKFAEKVYGTIKGDWRLKLLKEDLAPFYGSKTPLNIWDAGCGLGQIALWLANAPAEHRLTLCDLSKNMLKRAQQTFEKGLQTPRAVQFLHGAAQEVAPNLEPMDLVLFHAVLEWLAQPKETLKTVANKVKPGGHLSLLFYNRNALVYTNVLKGEWRWKHLLDESYIGKGKKLTPPNPQYPEVVIEWLESWGFTIEAHTGIRVFYDYLTHEVLEKSHLDELLELEYRHCRQPTYRNMGRYIHLVARKS